MKLSQQCVARAKSSGQRCANRAILGATVCRVHGGAAPQVRKAAAARLEALTHPAIDRLEELLTDDELDTAVLLRVITAVLDRVGFHPSHGLELTGHVDMRELTDHELVRIIAEETAADPDLRHMFDVELAELDDETTLPDRRPAEPNPEGLRHE